MTNVASTIISVLAFMNIPVAQTRFEGAAERYIVFRLDDYPDAYADDSAQAQITEAMIHYFTPFTTNTRKDRKKICDALESAGFTRPTVVDASENKRSDDGTEQHLVFECQIESGVDDDE